MVLPHRVMHGIPGGCACLKVSLYRVTACHGKDALAIQEVARSIPVRGTFRENIVVSADRASHAPLRKRSMPLPPRASAKSAAGSPDSGGWYCFACRSRTFRIASRC